MMSVSIVNDGPVTIQLDSRKFEYEKQNGPVENGDSGAVERKQANKKGASGKKNGGAAAGAQLDTEELREYAISLSIG